LQLLEELRFRDPDYFIPDTIHKFYDEWVRCGASDQVLSWIKEGINVNEFFKHFKGKFYDSDLHPSMYFPNAGNCKEFVSCIVKTLKERLINGSLSLVGKVGFCEPPFLVLPLTVEPKKPRLCHDERYLK